MKKITLSIGLIAAILSVKAQDTTCTYFKGKDVFKFDYNTSEPISYELQTTKFYDIDIKHGNVLCLDLSDDKNRMREVITTYSDGVVVSQVVNSKNKVYYTENNVSKVSVGKSKWIIAGKPPRQ